MLAGSFASTYHGTPRATRDIDLVIDPARESLDAFVAALPPEDFYVSHEAARDAFARRSRFNVIDLASGWKFDLIIRKERPFSVEEFGRRERAELFSVRVYVTSAEDTVISKLEWAREGESERQLRDVAGVAAVKGEDLDRGYIERWARELGLVDLWQQALELARET